MGNIRRFVAPRLQSGLKHYFILLNFVLFRQFCSIIQCFLAFWDGITSSEYPGNTFDFLYLLSPLHNL